MKNIFSLALSILLALFSAKVVSDSINAAKDPDDFDRILKERLK